MKRPASLFLFNALLWAAVCPAAEPEPIYPEDRPQSFAQSVYVVETTEEDATASLDRISGDIDRGFAADDYTYDSENHHKAGPFGRQEAADNAYRTTY